MKVLMVNGSPNEHGCTNRAMQEIARALREDGVDSEIRWIGKGNIAGCTACRGCAKAGRCVIDDGPVNDFVEAAKSADGFVFGGPVHFASLNGAMCSFMDRAFFSMRQAYGPRGPLFLKPVAAITSARRAGTTAALDRLSKYITYNQSFVVTTAYWPMVHGNTPEEVERDEEGMFVMRTLGHNMAYAVKLRELAAKHGLELPKEETAARTNFIR